MTAGVQTGTITTEVAARLDRMVLGVGGVWTLDGREVTMVGNVASRLTEEGSGIELTAARSYTFVSVNWQTSV